MLLETLDIRKNDILIYSENRFDFEQNFKIIYKNSASKKPEGLHFSEVGKYIISPAPKNLILYRLITNLSEFNSGYSQFSFTISINGKTENIYFDPIFAVKDLEKLQEKIDFSTFRFKIQQIGLTNTTIENNPQNFSEVYYFDLKADEAKNQNDRVFAEAIFSLIDLPLKKEQVEVREKLKFPERIKNNEITRSKQNDFIISEDSKSHVDGKLKSGAEPVLDNNEKIDFREFFSSAPLKSQIQSSSENKSDDRKSNSSMTEFLKRQKESVENEKSLEKPESLLYMFKSTADVNNYLKDRASESVILKFKKV